MSQNAFRVGTYFDLAGVSFSSIFNHADHVWDALKFLDDYIARQFETGILKSNHGKDNNVYIGEGTTIEEGVLIKGPAIIGKNCEIRHGAYLRPGVLIGDNVVIGHGTEIKHSIIMNGSAVPHVNVVLDSILGSNVNFAGGAITANFRFDKRPVKVKFNNHPVETGLLKFGAIIGDGGNVGVNAVLNPGTMLGKKVSVHPLTSVKGVHPENAFIR